MKLLSIELEDELFAELEKVCEELNISKEVFLHEALKSKIVKKDHQLEKINDSKKMEKSLSELDGEDEWM